MDNPPLVMGPNSVSFMKDTWTQWCPYTVKNGHGFPNMNTGWIQYVLNILSVTCFTGRDRSIQVFHLVRELSDFNIFSATIWLRNPNKYELNHTPVTCDIRAVLHCTVEYWHGQHDSSKHFRILLQLEQATLPLNAKSILWHWVLLQPFTVHLLCTSRMQETSTPEFQMPITTEATTKLHNVQNDVDLW